MTQEKYDELEHELKSLYKRRQPATLEVSRLAELGDFSENVEYQLAKGRLRGINSRILVLEEQLKRAEIITLSQTDTVQVGSTVTILLDGEEKTFTILGSSETNPSQGIISHTSPIGAALLGKKAHDTGSIVIRDSEKKFSILSIRA